MKKLYALTFTFLFLLSCDDKDDNIFVPDNNLEVQDFIWKGLNLWYYWQDDVNDLADNRFSSNQEYASYLDNYSNPGSLFDALIHQDDRFSYITDDYNDLLNSQQGVFKTNGVEYGLSYKNNSSNEIFGYVWYILPGTDAEGKNIMRGDIFTGVNGQPLTDTNYIDLLFGTNDTYTLNMADYDSGNFTSNGIDITLTKSDHYTENPIYISKTITLDNQKIGYLMYNSFTAQFDDELNATFGQFKSDGITALVLDLRYNPGGSVNSSANLASMISTQSEDKLFIRLRYNGKLQEIFGSNRTDYHFRNTLDGNVINSLNLNRVYVLTTDRTASASELIINGLDPYIQVIQIGTTTVGKNEASVALFDSDSYQYDDDSLNPNHTWGMQPIISRNENSVGFSDYTDGFDPEIKLMEDIENMGILGDINEPFLARALQEITGAAAKPSPRTGSPVQSFKDSKVIRPSKDNMYIETERLQFR
ncbi:S41 family peptidase [Zhouia spongiae]|uniref:S41 family peptidase n=1 Tax=Zhouia spongiae TaxID=2202721 RepID=A0ABY3YII7_9FLAO|nr:S41 family peptidase [Zhouia spongiae]UNY97681.1 S41 family peptidase [Zhouia spongiae]